jgi:hypothetical protein
MTSKTIALKVLDTIIATAIGMATLSIAGVPIELLSSARQMSSHEFRAFLIFVIFAALWLMHEIAVSDSAP